MTENSESSAAGKAHTSSRNPALEGDSGHYPEGDYGDVGAVRAASDEVDEGEYPEGDYGKAGTGTVGQELPGEEESEYPEGGFGAAGTAREPGAADDIKDELTDGQVNAPRKDDGGTTSGA